MGMYGQVSFKIGDVIEQEVFGGGRRFVLVEDIEDDIKNGRPGFHGPLVDEAGKPIGGDFGNGWGYSDQVVRVVRAR